MVIALPIEEVPGGDRVALPWIRPHHDELIRVRKRQRRKQRRVNHGEDCRGGADPKRESRDDRNRQTGILAQHAHTIAKILEQIPHGPSSLRSLGRRLSSRGESSFPAKGKGGSQVN